MWKCPECKALNYETGPCECCGYSGNPNKDSDYRIRYWQLPSRTDDTTSPTDIWYGKIYC